MAPYFLPVAVSENCALAVTGELLELANLAEPATMARDLVIGTRTAPVRCANQRGLHLHCSSARSERHAPLLSSRSATRSADENASKQGSVEPTKKEEGGGTSLMMYG